METFKCAAVVLASVALASLALIAVGCGSDSGGSGVAQAPTTSTSTSTSTQPSQRDSPRSGAAFAACMRSHGVPDFPDPKVTSKGEIISMPDDDSPRFRSGFESCRKLLPNGGVPSPAQQAQEQEQLLEFAACMRAHGVRDFPDPTFSDGRPEFPEGRIKRNSPRFAAAKKAFAGVIGE
jgi:hypothetical protein